jgi:hypothetical protein
MQSFRLAPFAYRDRKINALTVGPVNQSVRRKRPAA